METFFLSGSHDVSLVSVCAYKSHYGNDKVGEAKRQCADNGNSYLAFAIQIKENGYRTFSEPSLRAYMSVSINSANANERPTEHHFLCKAAARHMTKMICHVIFLSIYLRTSCVVFM